jgi:RNA polymerase sigma-70 factor (ECF subfamily)
MLTRLRQPRATRAADQVEPDSSVTMRTEDDPSLVRAAQRDSAVFGALYRRYVTPVYRYLYSRVGNAAEAEDLTAQVFIEALEGLPRYQERGHFPAWLFTIARRRAADHHRRSQPALPLNDVADPADDNDPQSHIMRIEALRHLGALVAQLDDDARELLRLRFAAGLTFGQIAGVLGRREGAVKMALHRLLERLKAMWEARDEHTH